MMWENQYNNERCGQSNKNSNQGNQDSGLRAHFEVF